MLATNVSIDDLLDNVPDINEHPKNAIKQNRDECGLLTKRIKTTNYAVGQMCRLSRDYNNNDAVLVFYRQGIKIEREMIKIEKEHKKPLWMEYFGF